MSMQCICTIQRRASSSFTRGKSTSRDSPSRGQVRKRFGRDPARHPLGRVLLEEEAPGGAFAEPLHRERPAAQMGDERGRDGGVVVPEIALRDAVFGEENPVGAREAHLAAATADDPLRLRAHPGSMPARTREGGRGAALSLVAALTKSSPSSAGSGGRPRFGLPGFSTIVRYTTMPCARPLLVTPSDA